MARFSVHVGVGPTSATDVDLQSPLLSDLNTRVVAPLVAEDQVRSLRGLNPIVEFNGRRMIVSIQTLTSVRRTELRRPVGDLSSYRDEIVRALDLLVGGL